jgi:hypothetical protein
VANIFGEALIAGLLVVLALLAGTAFGNLHPYRREAAGLLVGLFVAAATPLVLLVIPNLLEVLTAPFLGEVLFQLFLFYFYALGLFGSFTIIGIPLWLGLRWIGRGKLIDAALLGVVVAYLGWGLFLFLGGDRDLTIMFKPSSLLGAIGVSGLVGSLVAWHLVYGRKRPA